MQLLHAAFPDDILYFPAMHGEHGPPSMPVDPELHLQSVTFLLASGALEFVGHP